MGLMGKAPISNLHNTPYSNPNRILFKNPLQRNPQKSIGNYYEAPILDA